MAELDIVEKLICEFSIKNLENFFRNKIETFKPIKDDFTGFFNDNAAIAADYKDIIKAGEARLTDSEGLFKDMPQDLIVIAAETLKDLSERSGKKKQFEIAKTILKQEQKEAAFFIFYHKNKNFRFSFITEDSDYGSLKKQWTSFKRFTYFVSAADKTNKTFKEQVKRCNFNSVSGILKAFEVEPLNREFYAKIKDAFYDLVSEKSGKPMLELPSVDRQTDFKIYREFAVRLIGRIIFIWFLKKKKSANGISLIPPNWLTPQKVKSASPYYHNLLEKLFFQILNKPIDERNGDWLDKEHKTIPFLNGGLFQPQQQDYYEVLAGDITGVSKYLNNLKIPNQWFRELFETLRQFNFTIDENSIKDIEISIDPEMLGTIFENLLAEIDPDTEKSVRNSTGSFYTPRKIVDYMAEESLLNYLKVKTGIKEENLRLLFQDKDNDVNYTKYADEILEALDKMKIFDPACGSGAFPIGILHKIETVLEKIDPKAEKWKKKQLDRITDPYLREEIEAKLDNSTVEYIRKVGIVRNSIFGADIQTIATEISKLRCFLTLVVDEQINDNKKNRGIAPLPNLELKFITANTLIGLESFKKKRMAGDIDFGKTAKDIKTLGNISEKYLISYGDKKEELKKKFEAVHKIIVDKEIDNAAKTGKVSKIINWEPFKNEPADWFDSKYMFGVKDFDIVLGNPPYIQLQKAYDNKKKYADLYKDQNYKTFKRTGDIYALFYEKGINLLSKNGHLCYITSNKWMRAAYGAELRGFFALKNPLQLIDLGPDIFDSSTVDTNILLIQNNKPKQIELNAAALKSKAELNNLKKDFIKIKEVDDKEWIILSERELGIKKKIEKIGTSLKDWDIKIYRGVVTGYNKAFIIDKETKDKLIAEDKKSAEILKPLLRGRDIKKYKAEFADLWLIFIPWHFPLHKDPTISGASEKAEEAFKEQYPAIYKHLLQHKDRLSKRNKEETGIRYEWYALQRCAASYYEEFEKEKIAWQRITHEPTFCISEPNQFILDSMAFLSGFDKLKGKYILAVLNSNLIKYWVSKNVHQYGITGYRLSNQYVEIIPIPQIPQSAQKKFEKLVNIIIDKKKAGANTQSEEKKIDIMTYKLYELTYDEVKIIDLEFNLTKKEYESLKYIE